MGDNIFFQCFSGFPLVPLGINGRKRKRKKKKKREEERF
jgi:hypothetical protein